MYLTYHNKAIIYRTNCAHHIPSVPNISTELAKLFLQYRVFMHLKELNPTNK